MNEILPSFSRPSHSCRRSDLVGVMSLWTGTPMFSVQRGPMLIQTFAIHLAARVFHETEFVTDSLGASIARTLHWPFARIRTPMDTWPVDGLQHIWALGKLVACAIQERPFVQFDGDVLLFKPLPKRLTKQRLIAQSPDFPQYYTSKDMLCARTIAGFSGGIEPYNAGLIGGADCALVRAYAWAGLELATKFRNGPINGTTTSMLIEQYQLGVFAQRVGVRVGTLLPMVPTRKQVAKAGYTHLQGGAKRDPYWIAAAESAMGKLFPEALAHFNATWPEVERLTSAHGHDANSYRHTSVPSVPPQSSNGAPRELLHDLQRPSTACARIAAMDS